MGKPTWVITPILPYHTWAYQAPENKYSPWYKSVVLFRQKAFSQWDETFKELYSELENEFRLTKKTLVKGTKQKIKSKIETTAANLIFETGLRSSSENHGMHVDSAYIIHLPKNPVSASLASRCQLSCQKVNMPVHLYEGFDATSGEIKIPQHLSDATWHKWLRVTDHHLSATEIACALSHISLWVKCMDLNKPIVILEHDAIMLQPYLYHQLYNGIIYLGCKEQLSQTQGNLTPPFSSINKNWLFMNRAHAYAIDPQVAKKLFTLVLNRGIFESLDIMIQTSEFTIAQTGLYAYDEPGITTITNRKQDIPSS
jgi:hypothetical protein